MSSKESKVKVIGNSVNREESQQLRTCTDDVISADDKTSTI